MRLTAVGGLFLIPLFLFLSAKTSNAEVAPLGHQIPQLHLKITGQPELIQPGQPFEGAFQLTAFEQVMLSGFNVESQGTPAELLQETGVVELSPGESFELRFRANNPMETHALTFSCEVNGRPYQETIDLAAEISEATAPPRVLKQLSGEPPRPFEELSTPEPISPSDVRYSFTVSGRFVYYPWSDGDNTQLDARPVYGIRVSIRDEDPLNKDDVLAVTHTDANGYFFAWIESTDDNGPDIFVRFESKNEPAVVVERSVFERNYFWRTRTYSNQKTALDMGVWCEDESMDVEAQVLHIFSSLRRGWDWYVDVFGKTGFGADVIYPAKSDWTTPYLNNQIHISRERGWDEQTHLHEYAHAFQFSYGYAEGIPDYNNENCDAGPTFGHCTWCDEKAEAAWFEAVADWLSLVQLREWPDRYGLESMFFSEPHQFWRGNLRSQWELVKTCWDTQCGCDEDWTPAPLRTEGFLTAMMWDMVDDEADAAPSYDGRGADDLNLSADYLAPMILGPGDGASHDFESFLDDWQQTHPSEFAAYKDDIWRIGLLARLNLDTAPPGIVGNAHSISHEVGVESHDPTITINWDPAPDDWSGPAGYSIAIGMDGDPGLPDEIPETEKCAFETAQLDSFHSYFVGIRAVDVQGRWSPGYALLGPFPILEPGPSDCTFRTSLLPDTAGVLLDHWSYPLVLTDDVEPDTLDVISSWPLVSNMFVHAIVENDGNRPTPVAPGLSFRVDGEELFRTTSPVIPFEWHRHVMNMGPFAFTGGWHTISVMADPDDEFSEQLESNNVYGYQLHWAPEPLAEGFRLVNSPPPYAQGGWEEITKRIAPALDSQENGEEYRFSALPMWKAVGCTPVVTNQSYDLRLDKTEGVPKGFSPTVARTACSARKLGLIVANASAGEQSEWDVSISSPRPDPQGGYVVGVLSPVHVDLGDTARVTLAVGQAAKLFTVHVEGEGTGDLIVSLRARYGSSARDRGPLRAAWFGKDVVAAPLDSADVTMYLDGNGSAVMAVPAPGTGVHALVVYRAPVVADEEVFVELITHSMTPDLAVYHRPGWCAPLALTAAPLATPDTTSCPLSLAGDNGTTYVSGSIKNVGAVASAAFQYELLLDGVTVCTATGGPLDPGADMTFLNVPIVGVRGGMHTVSVVVDPLSEIIDFVRTNNVFGLQYVWSPAVIAENAPVVRPAPGLGDGGWPTLNGQGTATNTDGLRMQLSPPSQMELTSSTNGAGYWVGAAIMPGDSSDVDLRLYEMAAGCDSGFVYQLASSRWLDGSSDYVLADFRSTDFRSFDVGVVRGKNGGEEPYTVEVVRSTFLGSSPIGAFGPFTMSAGHMLELHELWLPSGNYRIELTNIGGTVDWGMTLHPQGYPFMDKSMDVTGSSFNGSSYRWGEAGGDELLDVEVPTEGYHGLAVWKVGSADLAQDGTYELSILPYLTIVASADSNGTISPSDTVSVIHGTNQQFVITPDECYRVADVLIDGTSVGPVTSYTFENVTTDHTIVVSFAANTTIAATAGPNGSISPSGDVTVSCGGSQEFIITPDDCHQIADVLIDGSSIGAVTSYTIENVMASHTIAASFVSDPPVCYASPDTIDFGTVEAGCYGTGYLTLRNTACDTLSGTVTLTSPFELVTNPSYALGPGKSKTWTVRFEPTAPGTYNGFVDTGSPLCADVTCVGVAEASVAPVCYMSHTEVNFGNVIIGDAESFLFRIQNNGGGVLTGDVSENCEHYRIVSGGGPFSLACNELVYVEVEFAPTSEGTHPCTIETGGACADFSCTGVGVEPPPLCTVSETWLEFGTVTVGSYQDLSFVLRNAGGGTLTGSITKPSTGDCDNYTLMTGGGPYSLGALDSVVVVVRFAPVTGGPMDCFIDTGCLSDVYCNGAGRVPNLLYVDQDATGAMTGASWGDAFVTLQQALDVSPPPHGAVMVWVAEGTYKPSSYESTFDLKNKWSLLGGFAGVETSVDERDPEAHPTILSGELGNPSSFSDNCRNVVTADYSVDSTALLDGFTVTRGNAISSGGGVKILGSPRITNVTIVDNQASYGGGMSISDSNARPTLRGVTFDGNRATTGGSLGGGGLYIGNGSPRLYQVTFRNNTSTRDGGGLYCDYAYACSPVLDGVLFVDNTASRYGGGMLSKPGSAGSFANLAFVGNVSSNAAGGGLYLPNSTVTTLTNVSFSRNSAATTGGGIYFENAGPHLVNAILWGNTAPEGSQIRLNGSPASVISYSLIQGCGGSGGWNTAFGTDGGGNLDADPMFVDALADNLQLNPGSPAIDTGNHAAAGLPATDLLGNPRISGATVDMGAYEVQTEAPALAAVLPTQLVFDEVPVNQTTCDTIYVTNIGDANLAIAGISGCGAAPFALDTTLTNHELEGGDTTLIVVCVSPTTEGGASCEITIVSNATNSPTVIPVELQTVTGVALETTPRISRIVSISPNPFNPTTRIRYEVESQVRVSLSVFDVNGRLVNRLVDEVAGPGTFTVEWSGTNKNGDAVSTGVYFCRFTAGSVVEAKKMVLLK